MAGSIFGRYSGGLYTGEDHVLLKSRSILAVATSLIFAGVRPLSFGSTRPAQQDAQREEGEQRAAARRAIFRDRAHGPRTASGRRPGGAALEQALKRLGTTASLMMIVAHPDDEDGALLTYLSRGLGVRATLFTLTRGEGGQNAMSADATMRWGSFVPTSCSRPMSSMVPNNYGARKRILVSRRRRKNRLRAGDMTECSTMRS